MINFNQFEQHPIFDPEEIHSYGDAVRFAYSVFNFFNGKVNPHFRAHAMILSDGANGTVAEAVGDVVVFYSHFLMHEINIYQKDHKSAKLKGYILLTIIHELFHMEQDFSWYHKRYKKSSTANMKIEEACYIMTDVYLRYLTMCDHINYPFINGCYSPSLSTFINYDDDTIEQMRMNIDKLFVRVSNPVYKALWVMSNCIYTDNPIDDIIELADKNPYQIHSIYARVSVNEIPIKENYIRYNGVWGSKEIIMDIIRPVLLMGSTFSHGPHVTIRNTLEEMENKYGLLMLDIHINTDNSNYYMELVDKVAFDSHITPYI